MKKPESMPRAPTSSRNADRIRPRARRSAGRGGTLLGVFIGLVLGLGLAATVAYYVTKANSPYQAQAAKDAREPARDTGKGIKTAEAPSDKPRFDFYKILPGGDEPKVQADRKTSPSDHVAVEQAKSRTDKSSDTRPTDAKAADVKAPDAKAPDKAAPAADASARDAKPGERYWLQAGAYSTESDAENMKAQLALGGWEAIVTPTTQADKGVRYRVRLGPYDKSEDASRVKAELTKKGVATALVKF
jgi:cell division protein FtsN